MSPTAASPTHCHPQYRHLKPWIDVATRGLSDEAKARISEEVGAHFADAIEAGIQRGLTEEQAAREAVASLGSAWRAHLAFRRTYLTDFQARTLHHLRDDPWTNVLRCALFVFFVGAAVLFLPREDTTVQRIRIALLVVLTLAAVARAVVVPLLFRRARERSAVVAAAVAEFLLWTSFALSGIPTLERGYWILPLFGLLIGIGYLPIALKVHRRPTGPGSPGTA
jgi:hypothetical protein